MNVEVKEKVGTVKAGQIKEYRKNPSSINLAACAAASSAGRLGQRMIIIEGNSYMNKVYHIAKESEDITKYTVKPGKANVMIVGPNGDCYYGTAE